MSNLEELNERFQKNKEFLNFSISIKLNNKNKFSISYEGLEEKYKKAMNVLVRDLLTQAKAYIQKDFFLDVLEEDKEMEYLRFKKTLDNEMELLLNCLVNNGLDAFKKNTAFLSMKYKQLYELANIHLENGELIDRRGNKIA